MLAAEEVGTEVLTGEYLSQWLRHSKGRLRSKTHEGYEGLIRLYAAPALGGIVLARLHPLHLQECYASLLERGLAGGTVLNLHLVLAQALSQAVRWGLIERSPASGAQPPRPRRPEPVAVDPVLAARILQAVAGTPSWAQLVLTKKEVCAVAPLSRPTATIVVGPGVAALGARLRYRNEPSESATTEP